MPSLWVRMRLWLASNEQDMAKVTGVSQLWLNYVIEDCLTDRLLLESLLLAWWNKWLCWERPPAKPWGSPLRGEDSFQHTDSRKPGASAIQPQGSRFWQQREWVWVQSLPRSSIQMVIWLTTRWQLLRLWAEDPSKQGWGWLTKTVGW